MQLLASLLIVAATGVSPQAPRHPDAVEVFSCAFDSTWDGDYDRWPDHWERKTGPGFPRYLKIGLEELESDPAGRCLQIALDGGAATVHSPAIEVDSRYSYVLETRLRTTGLKHGSVVVTLSFFDARRRELETVSSAPIKSAANWTAIRLGPLIPKNSQAESAQVGLHFLPGSHADLKGHVQIADVWLARLPRMVLTTNNAYNVYSDPNDVRVKCELSGISERDPEVLFELLDASSNNLARSAQRLEGELIAEKATRVTEQKPSREKQPAGYSGTAEWRPPLSDFGFYRVRVSMRSQHGTRHERQTTLAVVRPHTQAARGEFGWSLPQGDNPLSLEMLQGLLPQVGIHWLKFPVWYRAGDEERGDRLLRFAERLSGKGIETVGLVIDPPEELQAQFGSREAPSAASLFAADAEVWRPSLDPVMNRLSLKIRWWQLGGDRDVSFVGYPNLPAKIADLKKQLYRFGQEVHLGLGWQWISESPGGETPPWAFLNFSAEPALTGGELAEYLPRARRNQARWVLVEPLPRKDYPMEVRARDLVDQMMAAKIHEADAVFLPEPISTERGVMNDDGTPGELLLPWRTTALLLGGAEYVGSLRLPSGSRNHIFARDGEGVMVVWNDRPVREQLYLGENVKQFDVWGRMIEERRAEHEQIIDVNPFPTFVTGVDANLVRWSMSVRFKEERMPSVFGKPHLNALLLKNFYPQGAGGEVTFVMPEAWGADPQKLSFKLAAGEALEKPFRIELKQKASSGREQVRLDFDVHVDRHYKFSVYRDLEVGLGDVVVEITTKIDESGDLLVEQRMTNHTDEFVDFKCLLYAPNRRRQATQVFRLGRGHDVKRYVFANGQELLGEQLWLRAEETGGQRILNYRFIATQ